MAADEPLQYTDEEIRGFLPPGWSLDAAEPLAYGPEGSWDPKKRTWQIRVVDNVEFDWPVVVKADEAAALGSDGRLEALRRAMDKVYRERLGRRW